MFIEANDRAALVRLLRYCGTAVLRYCARAPFSMERLRNAGSAVVYRCAKQHSEPASDRLGPKSGELTLTPLELNGRIAALVPLLLAAVQAAPATTGESKHSVVPPGNTDSVQPELESVPPKRSPAHYLWAVLIARIYEVFPLLCPQCGGHMQIIAFITHGTDASGDNAYAKHFHYQEYFRFDAGLHSALTATAIKIEIVHSNSISTI
jgi:Putative transposase